MTKQHRKISVLKRALFFFAAVFLLSNSFIPVASAITADGKGGSLTWLNRARIRIDNFDFDYSNILQNLRNNSSSYAAINALGEAEFKKKVAEQYTNAVFGDNNFDDSPEYFYIAPGCSSDKASKITGGGAGLNKNNMAVRGVYLNVGDGNCVDLWPGDRDIPFNNFEKYNDSNMHIVFNWVNKYEIVRVDKQNTPDAFAETFKVTIQDKPNLFYKVSEDASKVDARDYVDVDPNKRTGVYHMVDTGQFSDTNNDSLGDWYESERITKTYNNVGNGDWYVTVDLGDRDKSNNEGTIGETTTVSPDGAGGADAGASCEETMNFALAWAICGVLNLIDDGVTTLYRSALAMLTVKQSDFDRDGRLQETWSYFRNIASMLLVVIGLVMIIGQAINRD